MKRFPFLTRWIRFLNPPPTILTPASIQDQIDQCYRDFLVSPQRINFQKIQDLMVQIKSFNFNLIDGSGRFTMNVEEPWFLFLAQREIIHPDVPRWTQAFHSMSSSDWAQWVLSLQTKPPSIKFYHFLWYSRFAFQSSHWTSLVNLHSCDSNLWKIALHQWDDSKTHDDESLNSIWKQRFFESLPYYDEFNSIKERSFIHFIPLASNIAFELKCHQQFKSSFDSPSPQYQLDRKLIAEFFIFFFQINSQTNLDALFKSFEDFSLDPESSFKIPKQPYYDFFLHEFYQNQSYYRAECEFFLMKNSMFSQNTSKLSPLRL